tara:strand:+ start:100 stop:537 length:438 start_codon:yes stop_codon:yes gene_type:complete
MILVSDEEWEEHRTGKKAKKREWEANNKDKRSEINKTWREGNPEKVAEGAKAWREDNPKYYAFGTQRQNAKTRGIPFHFSFEGWWEVWGTSGKWEQRGKGADKYCMCRTGDEGPYEYGNVRVDTNENNLAESREIRSKLKGLDDE